MIIAVSCPHGDILSYCRKIIKGLIFFRNKQVSFIDAPSCGINKTSWRLKLLRSNTINQGIQHNISLLQGRQLTYVYHNTYSASTLFLIFALLCQENCWSSRHVFRLTKEWQKYDLDLYNDYVTYLNKKLLKYKYTETAILFRL